MNLKEKVELKICLKYEPTALWNGFNEGEKEEIVYDTLMNDHEMCEELLSILFENINFKNIVDFLNDKEVTECK